MVYAQASKSFGVLQGGEAVENPDVVTGACEDDAGSEDEEEESDDDEEEVEEEDGKATIDGCSIANDETETEATASVSTSAGVASHAEATSEGFCTLVNDERDSGTPDSEDGTSDEDDSLDEEEVWNNHEFLPHRDAKPPRSREASGTVVHLPKPNRSLDQATIRERVKKDRAKRQSRQKAAKSRARDKTAGGRRKESTRQKSVPQDVSF